MKQYLDEQQTAKLIELGFERPFRNEYLYIVEQYGYAVNKERNFTIGELLSFLPENIAKENEMPSTLNISLMNGEWCVEYADFLGADFSFHSVELIDALYYMLIDLLEHDLIRLKSNDPTQDN